MFTTGKVCLERLPRGGDLAEAVAARAAARGIACAEICAVGAVSRARIGYYLQDRRRYRELDFPEAMEIVSCLGTITEKDGAPFLHAHLALAREDGSTVAGHLLPGTVIFACECLIRELVGDVPRRAHDPDTGLSLWESSFHD